MNPLVATQLLKNINVKKTAMYVGGALVLVLLILYVRKKIDEAQEAKKGPGASVAASPQKPVKRKRKAPERRGRKESLAW